MGYSSSGGTKGRGVFNNSPSTTSDFNQLLTLLATYANHMGGITESARDAITGDALYEGLSCFNTDSGCLEVYDGSGWEVVWAPQTASGSVVPTTAGVYSVSENELFTRNGRLLGTIRWSMSSGSLAHGGVICTLPVGARPATQAMIVATGDPSPSQPFLMAVTTGGEVTALSPPSGRTNGKLHFEMAIPL